MAELRDNVDNRCLSEDGSTSSDSSDHESGDRLGILVCSKLPLPEHIAAYFEKRDLIRDSEPIACDAGLVENVMSNYIIAKNILSNVCWQEKILCKHVCSTWRSAIHTLRKEKLEPVDFSFNLQKVSKSIVKFKKSGNFYNEPLAVLLFSNRDGMNVAIDCEDINPCPCPVPCKNNSHCLIDTIHQQVAAPKNCMLTVVATYLTYMPLPNSLTSVNTIPRFDTLRRLKPFMGGVYIPVIPNVEFHVLNIRQKNRNTINMQTDFLDEIDKLAKTRIFKGVLVYVTEKYILESVEEIIFLNYLKDVQPDIPYALGGCIVEETVFEQKDISTMVQASNTCQDFVSENLISIGLFTVPKEPVNTEPGEKYNFEMYSLVIDSTEWPKRKVEQAINEFATKVPHFEHSLALKLSCVGRDKKHTQEQEFFRAAFPATPLLGCYGNGELGINYPPRPPPPQPPCAVKRRRDEVQSLMYSYSTVFVYIGWGKVAAQEEPKIDK